jgi:hypothetical protein
MLGRIDCEKCDDEGTVEVEIVGGGWATVDCDECHGWGGWALYGPPTREQAAEIEARNAAFEADSAKWATFVCTHCETYCDAHVDGGLRRCWRCDDGILVPLRDLQAVARPALPWRRRGDEIVMIEPPDPRQGDLFATRAPCDPPSACATHGRCWMHSEWDWETMLPAGWIWIAIPFGAAVDGVVPLRWAAQTMSRSAYVYPDGEARSTAEHPETVEVARWVQERNDRDPPKGDR